MTAKSKPKSAKLSGDELEAFLRRVRGRFKRQPGEKPFAEWWADYKREEKELEEAKWLRMERIWREQRQSAAKST